MDGEAGEAMPGYVKCIERKKKRTVEYVLVVEYKDRYCSLSSAYDHTTLNTPVLVRSPKLSSVGPA